MFILVYYSIPVLNTLRLLLVSYMNKAHLKVTSAFSSVVIAFLKLVSRLLMNESSNPHKFSNEANDIRV